MKIKYFSPILQFGCVMFLLAPLSAAAWGRRGHQIVGETAGILLGQNPENSFMRKHSYDLGYYANVPDFIWKRDATYKFEKPQHFMDLEIFEREFAKHSELKQPFLLTRQEFELQFPEVKADAGRAYWRIAEMNKELEKVAGQLRAMTEETGPARQALQLKWLTIAGTMAHYLGDLGMPLHLSENHDGQMTDQKGIHSYFEDAVVDELYPIISAEVNAAASKEWPGFSKKNKDKSEMELVMALGERSRHEVPRMLAIDKKGKRTDLKKSAKAYHDLIRQRLVDSSLTLAEIYRRQLGWKFDDDKFYLFSAEPEYMMPPGLGVSSATQAATKKSPGCPLR